MLDASALPLATILEVRDTCLCLATQRAARRLARRFDRAFQGCGLTNGQYSLLVFLSGSESRTLGELADFLAMDRTTVTAALKALRQSGYVAIARGDDDKRIRRVSITQAGRAAALAATRIWREEHAELEAELPKGAVGEGREFLHALAGSSLGAP